MPMAMLAGGRRTLSGDRMKSVSRCAAKAKLFYQQAAGFIASALIGLPDRGRAVVAVRQCAVPNGSYSIGVIPGRQSVAEANPESSTP
jgi:hypothetical protein